MQTIDITPTSSTTAPVTPWKVDTSRGQSKMEVSRQWASRPHDQRYLKLSDLRDAVANRYKNSKELRIASNDLKINFDPADPDTLTFETEDGQAYPSHWAFGQLCGLGEPSAPAAYLRKLPAVLAGLNLQHGLKYRGEEVKTFIGRQELVDGGNVIELRAVTGPDYGRIPDYEVVEAVERVAGDRFKVPGLFNWSDMKYNPYVEPTKDTTTLFASDRDVFIFLVDDLHPIVIGKLPDGSDDLVFRGFYVANSEVGKSSLVIATMYLRGSCCNRILWGVEGFQEIRMRHSKYAPTRFMGEAMPALQAYATQGSSVLLNGIKAAQAALVAPDEQEAVNFLQKKVELSKSMAQRVVEVFKKEEGQGERAPMSIWDMVQGITAVARNVPHNDTRLFYEERAGKLLDKVA
jgi:hypothetical protein